ncbi:unnamed protein product [Schistosoma mattheei]|uniref:Protein kinase domain-containing protein n=1 Tax=Schistosoma mattheei TaxID=31246 RepID=A0A183PHE3_9TREM|nr:unnamed protein product [Schistosoma mattheei]
MLYGVTPFYSETLVNTYANIMNHANSLKFPENVNVSDACLDFMKSEFSIYIHQYLHTHKYFLVLFRNNIFISNTV